MGMCALLLFQCCVISLSLFLSFCQSKLFILMKNEFTVTDCILHAMCCYLIEILFI